MTKPFLPDPKPETEIAKDSDLDVSVKKNFLDWVVRKCAEYGVYINDPE